MPFDPLELLLEMESEMTDTMTRFLARGAVASAEWQAQRLADVGALRAANIETVEKYMTEISEKLPEYYAKLGTEKVLESQIPGLSDVLPAETSAVLARTWAIWEYRTMNQLRNLGMSLIDGSQTAYIQIVYKTAAKMLSGATTLRQAIAETASQWLENGIPALVDKAGRNWSVEGYAQVVLRSNETQMTWASQEAAYDQYGVDLVEITSHLGARPNCAPYQGRVYSRSGLTPGYPLLSSTSIGQPDGIKGCNCGHDIWPYDPKIGRTYKPYPVKENNDAYRKSQKQRCYERQIRNAKRNLTIAENITQSKKVIDKARQNVANAQARMRKFIDESGRTRRHDREQIY